MTTTRRGATTNRHNGSAGGWRQTARMVVGQAKLSVQQLPVITNMFCNTKNALGHKHEDQIGLFFQFSLTRGRNIFFQGDIKVNKKFYFKIHKP
jgi:hypothetical protein